MRFVSIASGSSGNCTYVGSENTHLLVDAGVSGRRIEAGLRELGISGKDLSGILVTHEHSDHTKGLGVLARKYEIPIYATEATLEEIGTQKALGAYDRELLTPIPPDMVFTLGDLQVKPFRIDHDAADPVGYRICQGQKAVAVATDMGRFTPYTIENLQGLDAILLEANHDVRMLETGPYPYYLKRRILGDYGHLSNENAGRLLNFLLHDRLKKIFLGHLSRENNYEELAYETVCLEITEGDTAYKASDFSISVAARERMSEIVEV